MQHTGTVRNTTTKALLLGAALACTTAIAQDRPAESTAPILTSGATDIASVTLALKTWFVAGGSTMWGILFCSVLGLAFLLERLFRLRRQAFVPVGLAEEANILWQEGNFKEIEALCDRHRKSTLAKVIRYIVRKRTAPPDLIDTAIGDIAGRALTTHQMLCYPLLAVATIAPLLGLFGTVVGMIESFETVAAAGAMGDPTLLASGISKALITTEFGLIVAIPMLFFYHMIRLRTRQLNQMLEEEASSLVSDWLIEGEKIRT
jgi:biopolymer transport protein ExbB